MSEATAALTSDNGGAEQSAPDTGAEQQPTQQTQQAANGSWYSGLDPDTQAFIENKGWKEPTDLLTSYKMLEKHLGGAKNLVELPGEDAGDEAWDAVYARLGRPGSPDEYGLEVPEGGDEELAGWFKQTAHKLGLNVHQAKGLFQSWNETVGQKMEQMKAQDREQSEKDIAALKKEWGQGFDGEILKGKRAVAGLGLKEEQLSAYEQKLGTADMLKLFALLGSKMGEDSFEGGDRSGSSFGLTPVAAQQQIAELKMDEQFMKNYTEGNKDAVAKFQRLMEAAYNG